MDKYFLYKVSAVKLLSCLFAVLVFSRFAQLGDSENYINATFELSIERLTDRTFLTENFFALIALVTGRGLFTHLATALLVALTIFYVFKKDSKRIPIVFWVLLLMPLFAVWTSVVGKESLAFCIFLLISKWISEVVVWGKSNNLILLPSLLVGVVIRPHYLLAYAFIVIMIYFFLYRREISLIAGVRFSAGVYTLIMVGLAVLSFSFVSLYESYWEPYLLEIMKTAESYFLSYDGNSNRTWISWDSYDDFLSNMMWGFPISLIGPSLTEVIKQPLLTPFFIEGLLSIFLIFFFLIQLSRHAKYSPRIRFFLYVIFIPAIFLALLVHYPFGIFNPGSATRYKQALSPLMYFLPILIMTNATRKSGSI